MKRITYVMSKRRCYSSVVEIFDRKRKRLQLDATGKLPYQEWQHSRFLRTEIEARLLEKLEDIKGNRFGTVLDIGSYLSRNGVESLKRKGCKVLIQVGSSKENLNKLKEEEDRFGGPVEGVIVERIHQDEENLNGIFKGEVADLIVSNMAMHWVNDLPGMLIQCHHALVKDGLFLGSMLGENTLTELRESFLVAETEREGGVSPHVSPLAGMADAGNLLSRAQLSIPSVDTERIVVKFPTAFHLMHELGLMGEGNAVVLSRGTTPRSTMFATAAAYVALHGSQANGENFIPATFQVIFMTGWRPHEGQQKPLERGSAQYSLKDLEKILETLPKPHTPENNKS